MLSRRLCTFSASLVLALLCLPRAEAGRIKDLCEVQGARGNDMKGIGLVVGLAGTGDKNPAAVRAQQRMLTRFGIEIGSSKELKSDNCAVVVATGVFPAFAKEGTRFDVTVSSVYDCQSLEGGTLLDTHLVGADNEVYAVAQGPVSVGGFNAEAGGGGAIRKNHVTAGRIPMGAYVEREIPSTVTDGERITLLLKRPDFQTADTIQQVLNAAIAPDCAAALGAGTVNVKVPSDEQQDLVAFIARIQEITIRTNTPSRVVINERTGTIVVGGDVVIKPCQVAHGSLTIRVQAIPVVSQPAPFSPEGETVAAVETTVETEEMDAYLMPVEGASAADVAAALNKLRVTPRDMISIFQALREAGALEADLEIM